MDNLKNKSDEELLDIFLHQPDSSLADAAKQILEFRKHLIIIKNNKYLFVCTILLVLFSMLQVIVNFLTNEKISLLK